VRTTSVLRLSRYGFSLVLFAFLLLRPTPSFAWDNETGGNDGCEQQNSRLMNTQNGDGRDQNRCDDDHNGC